MNYYSNPSLKWEGMALGTAEEDSARVITETRLVPHVHCGDKGAHDGHRIPQLLTEQPRFVFAAQGDESDQSCAATAPTGTPSLPQATTGGYETTTGGYETTTGGYETTTGFVGCVMEPEVFLLVNRKKDLGDATRRFKRYISASNFTGGVTVDEDYRELTSFSKRQEQEWQWLRCAGAGSSSSYLVNRGSGAELNGYNGTTVTMTSYPEIGSAW